MPPLETPVWCLLRYCTSGNIQEHLLIRVEESDCAWRTAEDRCEVAYDWDVIAWRYNMAEDTEPEIRTQERERCAKICDERAARENDASRCETAAVLAARIRALR